MTKKYTYIAIDDNQDALKGIEQEMLHSTLFQCAGLFNCLEDVIIYLEKQSVDLVLCDVELSNGIISYEHLEKISPTIPIIFITGQHHRISKASFKVNEYKNVISCMCKPFEVENVFEVETLYQDYLNLGIDLASQNFRNKEIFLQCYRDMENDAKSIKVRAPEIVMIKPCDKVRGCEVYALCVSTPLYIKQRSLKDVFYELNENSPHSFIFVKRKGIVKIQNVQCHSHQFLPDETNGIKMYWCKDLSMEIPRRQQKEIEALFASNKK